MHNLHFSKNAYNMNFSKNAYNIMHFTENAYNMHFLFILVFHPQCSAIFVLFGDKLIIIILLGLVDIGLLSPEKYNA